MFTPETKASKDIRTKIQKTLSELYEELGWMVAGYMPEPVRDRIEGKLTQRSERRAELQRLQRTVENAINTFITNHAEYHTPPPKLVFTARFEYQVWLYIQEAQKRIRQGNSEGVQELLTEIQDFVKNEMWYQKPTWFPDVGTSGPNGWKNQTWYTRTNGSHKEVMYDFQTKTVVEVGTKKSAN